MLSIILGVGVSGRCGESNYLDRLTTLLEEGERGFLTNSSVVNPNTAYPILSNTPISMSVLLGCGELCGVRLGMSLSEVVQVWGKPTRLYSFCMIGPRMYYTRPEEVFQNGGVSLFFQSNRLELIVVSGKRCRDLTFDNGLTGMMGRNEIVQLLGMPEERAPKARFFDGRLVYINRNIRTDFCVWQKQVRNDGAACEVLSAIAIRFTDGVTIDRSGERDDAANGSRPSRSETEPTPGAACSELLRGWGFCSSEALFEL